MNRRMHNFERVNNAGIQSSAGLQIYRGLNTGYKKFVRSNTETGLQLLKGEGR